MGWGIIGLALVLYVLYKFINKIGESLPILELLLLIAGLQWIVGPYIDYITLTSHYRYFMHISSEDYFSFVTPAYMLFTSILLIGVSKQRLGDSFIDVKNESKGIKLVLFGFISVFLGVFLPSSLNFVVFLSVQLLYCGALILFFSDNRLYRILLYAALIFLFLNSLRTAMFHNFILWGAIFYFYWSIKKNKSKLFHISVILIGLFFMTVLQNVKHEYRQLVWGNKVENKVDLFVSLVSTKDIFSFFSEDKTQNDLNARLNQGWIISAIMKNIPEKEDFAKGQTIIEAIESSILPRFLTPNKKRAGGQENFRKFTGLELGDGTSMGISIMGEAYANFGGNGGIIFMGIWALFLRRYWSWLMKIAKQNPVLLFMIPLIFLQVVKAETELSVVLNHLVKSSVLVFGLFYIMGWHKINKESEKNKLAATSTSQTR